MPKKCGLEAALFAALVSIYRLFGAGASVTDDFLYFVVLEASVTVEWNVDCDVGRTKLRHQHRVLVNHQLYRFRQQRKIVWTVCVNIFSIHERTSSSLPAANMPPTSDPIDAPAIELIW